ncbi:MAG: zinc ribbon domain-containing protein [Christensenellales bacterium]
MNETNAEGADLMRLEEALGKKQHQLQAHYCQIGKSILEIADGEQKTIDALVDDIIEIRKKIVAIKHEIECAKCMTYNPPDSRYCRRCGTPLKLQSKKENEYAFKGE